MKTAIVGYPRIGAHRELKFASEQYFRGACTEAELQETAKALRLANLTQQKESGLDWIPSNDFSFYDGMLDTAFLLNAVPKRYRTCSAGYLLCSGKRISGRQGRCKSPCHEKMVQHQLPLHGTGTGR